MLPVPQEDAEDVDAVQLSTMAVLIDDTPGASMPQRRSTSVVEHRGNVVQIQSSCDGVDRHARMDGGNMGAGEGDLSLLALKSKFAPKTAEVSLRTLYKSPKKKVAQG